MFFNEVSEGMPDPVFGLTGTFKADPRPHKVDLMVGIYKDEDLKSELLGSVKEAKKRLLSHDLPADYLPFEGISLFCDALGSLLFGEELWKGLDGRTYAAEALGGTGALRVGAEFLAKWVTKTIYIPQPTWANHRQVFEKAGLSVEFYPYYNREKRAFDCEAMCQFLQKAPPKSAILLHATCHNPSGRDPSFEEWRRIFAVLKERELIPFFDCAYQGFGEGLEKDVRALQEYLKFGKEMFVAYSCSKNFSLYNERVGALFIVTEDPSIKFRVGSQVKLLIRGMYSNPPSSGARVVAEILKDANLCERWKKEVDAMRHRIESVRKNFIDRLVAKSKKVDFRYLYGHLGLFMFVDLKKSQVDLLIQKYGIYLLETGRISLAGLNQKNMDYVVSAIIEVCSS